jgi:hypothetical protein
LFLESQESVSIRNGAGEMRRRTAPARGVYMMITTDAARPRHMVVGRRMGLPDPRARGRKHFA